MERRARTRYLALIAGITLAVAFLPGIAPTVAQVADPPRLHVGLPDHPTGFVGVNFNPDTEVEIWVRDETLAPALDLGPWTVTVDEGTENGRVDFDFSDFSEPLRPGWTVQVDSPNHGLLSMVITDLVVTGWDVGTGLVYGTTNDPGEINFSIWAPEDANRHAVLTTSSEGFDWSADFDTAPSTDPGKNEFGGPFAWEAGNVCGQAEQSSGVSPTEGLTVYAFGDACGPPAGQPLIGGNLMSDILFVDDFTPNGQVQVTLTRDPDGTPETIFDDVLDTDDSGSVGGPNLFSLRLPVDPGMRLVATDVTDPANPGPTKELDLVEARVDAYDPVDRVLRGYTPTIPVGGYLMILGLFENGEGVAITIDPADHLCDPAGPAGTWCYQIPPQYEIGAYVDWDAGGLGIDIGDTDGDSTYTNLSTFRASGQGDVSGAASSEHDDTTSVNILVRNTVGEVVLSDFIVAVSELGEFEADFSPAGVQLEPGYEVIVTATDTGFSKALVLDPLRIDGIDFEGDTLFGVASPGAYLEIEAGGRLLNLRAGDDTSDGNPGDGLGAWIADFSVFHPEGFDLVDGMFARAAAIDPDLDVTWYEFFSEEPPPGPAFNVDPFQNLVEGYGWEEGTEVTITVDDGDPATGLFTTTALVERGSEEPGDVGFWTELEFDVEDGHLVTVTDGVTTKDHVVTPLTVDGIDEESDLVFGTAEPGSDVQVGLWGTETAAHVERAVVANGDATDQITDGYWEADFSVAVGPEEWQQARDVTPETFGAAWQGDEDGDATHVGFGEEPAPEPSIEVDPFFDKVFLNGMSELATLRVNGDDIDITAVESDGRLVFYLFDTLDIVTTDFVVVTDGDIVKEHTVKPLGVTDIDEAADTITGYTDPDAFVIVGAGSAMGEGVRFLTSDADGVWTAFMADPEAEGEGAIDIDKTKAWGMFIGVPDEDGDATVYATPQASPGMAAVVQYGIVTAEGSGLSDITISIPTLGYETTAPPEPAGPAMIGDIQFDAGVLDPEFYVGRVAMVGPNDLVPGLEIYSSDIMYEMQLTVLDFSVDEANTDEEELRGYIEPPEFGGTHVAIAFAFRDRVIDEPEDFVGIGFTEASEAWALPLCRPEALQDDVDPQLPGEQPGCTPDGLHDLGNGEVGWAFGLREPDPEFDTYTVLIWDLAPHITDVSGPALPVLVDTVAEVTATFTDIEVPDSHTATFDWGDGVITDGTAADGLATGTHAYDTAGVYEVTVTVTDEFGESDTSEYRYVVVYDPGAGFSTGGGWLEPEPGSEFERVNFGFNVKYLPNSTEPRGELNAQLGELHLHSVAIDWLVIGMEDWAHFAGTATIDSGAEHHPFRVDVRDGDIYSAEPDRFELRVWAPGADPYSADPLFVATGDIAGGSVRIHR